jgi:hypothetical protein
VIPVDLVADIDCVVLAVGADAKRSEQPSPQRDPVGAQRPLEHQLPPIDEVVGVALLKHTVDVHLKLVVAIDLVREPHDRAAHLRVVLDPAARIDALIGAVSFRPARLAACGRREALVAARSAWSHGSCSASAIAAIDRHLTSP